MRRYRASLVAATVLLLAAAPPASAADVSATVDDVVGVNDTDSARRNQPEPTIAINPRNTNVIAAGAQDFRRARELGLACGGERWNGFYLSTDGGLTWSNELVPGYCTDPTMGAGSEQAVSDMFGLSTNTDPVMVFDTFGNLFYSHIAFNNDPKRTNPPSVSGSLLVSTYRVSDAGAAVYAKTETVPSGSGGSADKFLVGPGSSNFDDKQWMTADNSPSSPFYGRIYVTWTKFGAQGGQSSINLSHCGGDDAGEPCDGSSWSRGNLVNRPVQGGLVQESFPTTAPDGTLYVAFLQFQGGFGSTRPHSGIWVAKSTDGGETFTQSKVASISQIPAPIPPQGTAANDGLNSFRTGTVPTIGVTADGIVHLAWGQWNGTDADVVYVRSTNAGATWSAQQQMGDATGHQFFPSLDTDGNNVHVDWYDSQLDPAGGGISALDVFYNRSTNSGASFAPDQRVTDVSFDPNSVSRFPVFCQAFIGDYIDLDAVAGRIATIWTDNRNVSSPLTPTECRSFIGDSTNPTIQPRLDGGALDQEAFVDVIP
jgi:hypothetical protein